MIARHVFRRSLEHEALVAYVERQLQNAFPDEAPLRLDVVIREATERARFCFAHIRHPAFSDADAVVFDHLHGDQYTMFLYYASNTACRLGDETLAKKLFLLNKALNGFFCMYDTELPRVMFLNHALGTVVGRGTYGNYLLVTQNVTFGKDREAAPIVGEGVIVYGGALIAGASTIGDGVSIAANTAILNADVPANSVVSGTSPNLIIKPRKRNLTEEFFRIEGS
jgi:serine O-acetyltransferase